MDQPTLPTQVARPSIRSALRWLLYIETDDAVRRTLNQGLQIVTLGLTGMALVSMAYALASDKLATLLPMSLFLLGVNGLAFWLTRGGRVGGAVLLVVCTLIAIAVGFYPETYIDPLVIHVLFLLPALIATLFITPWLGFPVALLQILCLALHSIIDGQGSFTTRLDFCVIGTLDLWALLLPMVLAASMFRRTIRDLAALNGRLDSQVAERTAELRRIMSLRESDITAIVHDIQNRMTVVRVEVDDLLAEAGASGADPATLRAAERRLSTAIRSTSDLVEDLRTAVQLDNAALHIRHEPVDLGLLTRRVVDQLGTAAAQSGCALRIETLPGPLIFGDQRKLERALDNLVGNAIKYSRQMPTNRRTVSVEVLPTDGGNEVRITDSGPGIDAEALLRLGQPFTRLASSRGTDGMGLGIYISRGIVELHGGHLDFCSPNAASGTIVTLWLPVGDEV
jgi:signal transduction histidine kinase